MRLLVGFLAIGLIATGCGQVSRMKAHYTGYDVVCVDGVFYLQFPSGVTVKYAPDGSIVTCR